MQLVVETFEVGAKSFVFPVTSVIKAEEVVQVKTQPGGGGGGASVHAATARRPQTRLISKHEVD